MNYQTPLYAIKLMTYGLFLILAGCTVSTSLSTASSNTVLASTATVVITQDLSMPTSTLTQVPSVTSTILPTATPITLASPFPIVTKTPISIPTPLGINIKEQVLWLYETNNDCLLPCWWGIIPGQTSWPIAERFLDGFDRYIYKDASIPESVYYGVGIDIPLPLDVFAEGMMVLDVLVQNNVVEIIETDVSIGNTPSGYLSQYTLSALLTTYGQPSEIWLSTNSKPFEYNELPFDTVLFYSDQGIMALYNDNGTKHEDVVRGCPQQNPVRVLTLWNPALDLTFEQASRSSAYNVDFLPLEEATSMDVISFYDTFKASENTVCLETKAELWR